MVSKKEINFTKETALPTSTTLRGREIPRPLPPNTSTLNPPSATKINNIIGRSMEQLVVKFWKKMILWRPPTVHRLTVVVWFLRHVCQFCSNFRTADRYQKSLFISIETFFQFIGPKYFGQLITSTTSIDPLSIDDPTHHLPSTHHLLLPRFLGPLSTMNSTSSASSSGARSPGYVPGYSECHRCGKSIRLEVWECFAKPTTHEMWTRGQCTFIVQRTRSRVPLLGWRTQGKYRATHVWLRDFFQRFSHPPSPSSPPSSPSSPPPAPPAPLAHTSTFQRLWSFWYHYN